MKQINHKLSNDDEVKHSIKGRKTAELNRFLFKHELELTKVFTFCNSGLGFRVQGLGFRVQGLGRLGFRFEWELKHPIKPRS